MNNPKTLKILSLIALFVGFLSAHYENAWLALLWGGWSQMLLQEARWLEKTKELQQKLDVYKRYIERHYGESNPN